VSTNPDDIDWSLTTWEGVRRDQLRRNLRLSLRERLESLDDLMEFARHFHNILHRKETKPASPAK